MRVESQLRQPIELSDDRLQFQGQIGHRVISARTESDRDPARGMRRRVGDDTKALDKGILNF